jgi:outer membrane protein assembly factor BamB
MQGRLYYNTRLGSSSWQGVACVDLRTGEELWFKNDMYITFGQIYNYKSPNQYGGIPYLLDTMESTWHMYDAFTGDWILDIANASSGSVVMSPVGELLVYVLNGAKNWLTLWNASRVEGMLLGETGTEGWQWRPPTGATLDWQTGVQWNVSVPDVPGTQSITFIGDVILATASAPETFARAASWQIEVAYDMKTGEQLWMQNRTFTTATTTWGLMGYIVDGVYTEYIASAMEWYAYDARTGTKIWGPTDAYTNAWSMYNSGACIAYGKFYDQNLGAIVAYDLDTGERLWEFTAPSSGFETAYGIFPFQQGGFTIADGKLYTATTHSHTEPLYRGAKLIALDAETGNKIWDISFWRTGWANMPAIADGYMVSVNNYDNQIYCFGKGQTATTVAGPENVQPLGASVLLKGTVLDQSPGAAGTPAIADEYMSEWMEYLYMQKSCPMMLNGVEVKLETLDPNGNFYEIGRTTSDASGLYSLDWVPPVPGKYTIFATFEGSGSYFRSYSETAILVSGATSAGQSMEPEPTEAPLITTEMALIIAAVIIAVALIAGFWILRKRK